MTDSPLSIAIQLEIVPEDEQDADPALVEGVERDTIDALRKEKGYTVQSVYTGKRGDGLFVVTSLLTTVATGLETYKDTLDITSALVTIFTPVVLTIKHVAEAYKKRSGKNDTQPVKVTIEVDGAVISVEAATVQDSTEGVLKLAKEFRASHSTVAANATLQSKVKVTPHLPKRQQHRRR